MAIINVTADMIEKVSTYGISTNMGVVYYPAIKLSSGIFAEGDNASISNQIRIEGHVKASIFVCRRTGSDIEGYVYHNVTSPSDPAYLIFTNIPVVREVTSRILFSVDNNRFMSEVSVKTGDQWEIKGTMPSKQTGDGTVILYCFYTDDGFYQMGVTGSYVASYYDGDPQTGSNLSDFTLVRRPSPLTPGEMVANSFFALSGSQSIYTFRYSDSKNLLDASVEVEPSPDGPSEDPYNKGGSTSGGGGTGTFSRTGDNISIPNLPTLSAVDAGFITLFNPSISELRSLAAYMWSDAFSIETFKKIFADPMDCILGMSIVPVNVPNGSSKEVKVGNIGTGVSMTTAATQYVSVDCGTLNVEEYWGAYLDYDPYTKAEIYLPYIGTHPVAIDDVMGKSVHVVYHIDILSGACIAFIQCGGTVIYSFAGQCASSIPITGNDWTNVINGVLQIAGSIGTMIATGGMSAPMNIASMASTAINSAKPQVEKSGALGGTGGMLGVQTPYLIITWPRQAVPYKQNFFKGYPSNITASLGSLSGFTVVDSIHLENVPATGEELDEIINLLREGVIL